MDSLETKMLCNEVREVRDDDGVSVRGDAGDMVSQTLALRANRESAAGVRRTTVEGEV